MHPLKRLFVIPLILFLISCAFIQDILSPAPPTPTGPVFTPIPEFFFGLTPESPSPTSPAPTLSLPQPTATVELPLSTSPATPAPTSTPTLASSPTPTSTNEVPSVSIGGWVLYYNPLDWGEYVRDQTQAIRATTWGEPGLLHRRFEGCLLRINMGMGVPRDWRKDQGTRRIGNLELQVEAWTDGGGAPVLTVYQYPPGDSGQSWRLELVINQNPHACIEAAEAIIAVSPGPKP